MKRLGTRVNLIPVIAKADTLTQNDLQTFKQRVSDSVYIGYALGANFAYVNFRFARLLMLRESASIHLLSSLTMKALT